MRKISLFIIMGLFITGCTLKEEPEQNNSGNMNATSIVFDCLYEDMVFEFKINLDADNNILSIDGFDAIAEEVELNGSESIEDAKAIIERYFKNKGGNCSD